MIFHQVATERGCQSYLIGCEETCAAVVVDPEISQIDRYLALASREGLRIHYLIDTHIHADHFSASLSFSEQIEVPVVMHRDSGAPFVDMRVDDGEQLQVGELRLRFMHSPGHTADSMCIILPDRMLTGDTLLIGGTGRTDLPTGDAEQLYHSLFDGLMKLDPSLLVYPGHDYRKLGHSTLEKEIAENPRLRVTDRSQFVEMMESLNMNLPTHLTEALRTNLSGGKTVDELLAEASDRVSFMSMEEVLRRIDEPSPDIMLLDVREKEAFDAGHVLGAKHLPRGQLELRVNQELPDPTKRIVVYCELGKISTLAAATLREMGFGRAVALDGGMQAWKESGFPVEETGSDNNDGRAE